MDDTTLLGPLHQLLETVQQIQVLPVHQGAIAVQRLVKITLLEITPDLC